MKWNWISKFSLFLFLLLLPLKIPYFLVYVAGTCEQFVIPVNSLLSSKAPISDRDIGNKTDSQTILEESDSSTKSFESLTTKFESMPTIIHRHTAQMIEFLADLWSMTDWVEENTISSSQWLGGDQIIDNEAPSRIWVISKQLTEPSKFFVGDS